MTFMERVKRMKPKEIASRPEVKAFWDKGLCWSLAHRRSFKYPLGVKLPKDDFFDYETKKEPVPLTEVELALLCWAGAGTNGLMRNDLSFAQGACTHPWFEGRVYPSPCAVWYYHLIFCNDDGIFLYRPHVPTKIVEIEGQPDMAVIFRAFREGLVQLSDRQMQVPENSPAVSFINKPFAFKPGVTTFFPICDVTAEYLNLYLLNADDDKRRLWDDELGKPAGIQKWIDNGYLTGGIMPMSFAEYRTMLACYTSCGCIIQNLTLAAAAMGLGGHPMTGVTMPMLMGATPVMRGLGFRFASDKKGNPYPVGIDGVIESHLPPYMSMDEAVEDVWNMKYKPGSGCYSPAVKEGDEVIYTGFDPKPRALYRPFKDVERYCSLARVQKPEAVQVAKDAANYVYDTYGRFPKTVDPIIAGAIVGVSHIDVDFYDRYQVQGSVWPEQREHFSGWHS